MSDKNDKRYRATVDHEDGSAEGVHFTTDGSEETVTKEVERRVPKAYFEEQADGSILIFASEKDAAKRSNSIGTVVLTSE